MTDHKPPLLLATAALHSIIGQAQNIQAETLRGVGQDEIDRLRGEAHDMLDAYLDHMTEAAAKTLAILGD